MSNGERPISIMVSGERVALGPLREDLAARYNEIRNDLNVQKFAGFDLIPVSLEKTVQSLGEGWASTPEAPIFTIYRHDTWQAIGVSNLRDVDHFHGSAEFGIMLHPDSLGQGYGTEAARLMLAYGFQMLNLHVIYLTADSMNKRGIRSYEKAGFSHAGRYREAIIVERQRCDLVHMDCLAREFTVPDWVRWGPPG